MRCKSLMSAFVAVLTAGLLCFGAGPASAEDDLGVHTDVSELGPYRYRTYQYPSRVTSFFLYPASYVTFDIVNGKYWEIESHRMMYEMVPRLGWQDVFPWGDASYNPLKPERLSVSFYTPDMKLLGSFDDIYANRQYSIPRDGNDYERIVAKIECDSEGNWDVKMRVWDPVDPVIAEPIPSQVFKR